MEYHCACQGWTHEHSLSTSSWRYSSGIFPLGSNFQFFRHSNSLQRSSPTCGHYTIAQDLLYGATPLIIPLALHFATSISTPDNQTHHHRLLFPEGWNLPIGLAWNIYNFILAAPLLASLLEISPQTFQTLLSLLDHPLVNCWSTTVSNQPALFAENAIMYSHFQLFYVGWLAWEFWQNPGCCYVNFGG